MPKKTVNYTPDPLSSVQYPITVQWTATGCVTFCENGLQSLTHLLNAPGDVDSIQVEVQDGCNQDSTLRYKAFSASDPDGCVDEGEILDCNINGLTAEIVKNGQSNNNLSITGMVDSNLGNPQVTLLSPFNGKWSYSSDGGATWNLYGTGPTLIYNTEVGPLAGMCDLLWEFEVSDSNAGNQNGGRIYTQVTVWPTADDADKTCGIESEICQVRKPPICNELTIANFSIPSLNTGFETYEWSVDATDVDDPIIFDADTIGNPVVTILSGTQGKVTLLIGGLACGTLELVEDIDLSYSPENCQATIPLKVKKIECKSDKATYAVVIDFCASNNFFLECFEFYVEVGTVVEMKGSMAIIEIEGAVADICVGACVDEDTGKAEPVKTECGELTGCTCVSNPCFGVEGTITVEGEENEEEECDTSATPLFTGSEGPDGQRCYTISNLPEGWSVSGGNGTDLVDGVVEVCGNYDPCLYEIGVTNGSWDWAANNIQSSIQIDFGASPVEFQDENNVCTINIDFNGTPSQSGVDEINTMFSNCNGLVFIELNSNEGDVPRWWVPVDWVTAFNLDTNSLSVTIEKGTFGNCCSTIENAVAASVVTALPAAELLKIECLPYPDCNPSFILTCGTERYIFEIIPDSDPEIFDIFTLNWSGAANGSAIIRNGQEPTSLLPEIPCC